MTVVSDQDTTSPRDLPDLSGLVWFDGDVLHVEPEAVDRFRLRRARWSPSSHNTWRDCPARWASRMLPEVPHWSQANAIGTAVHWVLECLYGQPHHQRTREWVEAFVATLETQARHLDTIPALDQPGELADWKAIVLARVMGVFDMEDPSTQVVLGRERSLDTATVNGVPFNGKIDRTRLAFDPAGRVLGPAVDDWKGLALDTPIPTPDGWSTMGALRVGDLVLGSGPEPVTVIGKSEVHHRPCYRLDFCDGTRVVCDNVHLWTVRLAGAGGWYTLDADQVYAAASRGMAVEVPSGHVLVSMVPVESVPTQCIAVDADDRLYRCGTGMVLTHNSSAKGAKSEYQRSQKDDHGDQGILYALALADLDGAAPVETTIRYTATGQVYVVDQSPQQMSRVAAEFRTTWDQMNAAADSGDYPVHESYLCKWCPFWSVCPGAARYAAGLKKAPSPQIDDHDLAARCGVVAREAIDKPGPGTVMGAYLDKENPMPQMYAEAKPWETVPGGLLNGSAYYTATAFGVVDKALECHLSAGVPVAGDTVRALAATFLAVIAPVQADLAGSVDLNSGLHTRLRGALYSALDRYPVPFGGDAEAWQRWFTSVQTQVGVVASIATSLLRTPADPSVAPYAPLVGQPAAVAS